MDPNQSWSRLPILATGDDSAEKIFFSVGAALTAWEMMEDNLANLFRLLLGAETEGAARAYGVIIAFSARMDMVSAALSAVPIRHDARLDGLSDLLKEIGKLSARRNEIAHGIVRHVTINKQRRGLYLSPPGYNTGKQPTLRSSTLENLTMDQISFGDYAYTASQIDTYATRFRTAARRLIPYIRDLQSFWAERRRLVMDSAKNAAAKGEPA